MRSTVRSKTAALGLLAITGVLPTMLGMPAAKAQQHDRITRYGANPGTYEPPAPVHRSNRRPLDGSQRGPGDGYGSPVQADPYGYPGIWQGLYLGINTGYSIANASSTTFQDLETSGLGFGGYAGYNLQLNQFVLGVEGDLAWLQVGGSKNYLGYAVVQSKEDFTGSLRLRGGYAFDNILLYLTGGIAMGHADMAVNHGVISARYANSLRGLVFGGGIDVKLSHNMSARLEALQYSFDPIEYRFFTGYLPVTHQTTTIRAGITLHLQ